jgi:hypothetical protein
VDVEMNAAITAHLAPSARRQWTPLAGRVLGVVTVLTIIVVGFGALWTHANTPGEWNAPPDVWPTRTTLQPPPGKVRIVMFAHPHCPCTRSSLAELERVLARAQDSASAIVLFLHPDSRPDSWVETTSWRTAKQIPNVMVIADPDGIEARRFGAATSGMTVVYSPEGQLLFAGGITASRGHEGSNPGTDALDSALSFQSPATRTCRVFGCSLVQSSPAIPRQAD